LKLARIEDEDMSGEELDRIPHPIPFKSTKRKMNIKEQNSKRRKVTKEQKQALETIKETSQLILLSDESEDEQDLLKQVQIDDESLEDILNKLPDIEQTNLYALRFFNDFFEFLI
jgi:hypothetical protein